MDIIPSTIQINDPGFRANRAAMRALVQTLEARQAGVTEPDPDTKHTGSSRSGCESTASWIRDRRF